MKYILSRLRQQSEWLFPISFTVTYISNFVFFYLGLALEENPARQIGFILVCCTVAVLCGLMFLSDLWENRPFSVKHMALLSMPLLFYTVSYAVWFLHFGIRGRFVDDIEQFIVLCIPAFFCGVCMAVRENERSFLEKMERLSFLILPGVVFYTSSAIFQCNPYNWGRDLGILNYMDFSYTVMPFLLTHMLRFADGEPFYLPLANRFAKKPQMIRGCFIAGYWYALMAAGTRGAYFCVFGFCVLLIFSRRVHHQPVKRTAITTGLLYTVLIFSMCVYTLPGLKAVGRMDGFMEGLRHGRIETSDTESAEVSQRLNDLVEADGSQQITNRHEEPTPNPEPEPEPAPDPGQTPEPEPAPEPDTDAQQPDIVEENYQIDNRGTMFKLCLLEFGKSPLVGMMPGGYGVKYGGYPHNVILELLGETGLLGTVPMMFMIILAIIRLILAGRNRKEVRYFLIFLMAYAIQANISATIWTAPALLWALGYGLAVSAKPDSYEEIALNEEAVV